MVMCGYTKREGHGTGVMRGYRTKGRIGHAACGTRIRTGQGRYTLARRHSKTTAFTFLTGRGRNKIVAHPQIAELPVPADAGSSAEPAPPLKPQEHRCRSRICPLPVRRHLVEASPFGTAWPPRSWPPAGPGTGRHTQACKPILGPEACSSGTPCRREARPRPAASSPASEHCRLACP